MKTIIDNVIRSTRTEDSPELRKALDEVVVELRSIFIPSALAELPSAYILNLAVLQETKGLSVKLVIEGALAYALENNKTTRAKLAHFLGIQHLILDTKPTNTTTH